MIIQSKNKKTEAKIFSTTHPFVLVHQLNTSGLASLTINNQKINYVFDEENDNFGVYKNSNPNVLETSSSNRSSNGYWEIELIIGPFEEHSAIEFTKLWTSKSRGIDSRRQRGLEIFRQKLESDINLKCYNKHIIPLSPPIDFWLTAMNINIPEHCTKSQITKYYSRLKTSMSVTNKKPYVIDSYDYSDAGFSLKIKGYYLEPESSKKSDSDVVREKEFNNRDRLSSTETDIVIGEQIVRIFVDTNDYEYQRKDVTKYSSSLSHTFSDKSENDDNNKIVGDSKNRKYKKKVKEKETVIEMKIPCILCTDSSLLF